MKVRDITIHKNINYTKKIYDTFSPLNVILKIFALNSNDNSTNITNKSCMIFRSVIATAILGILNFCTLYYKINNVYSQINASIKVTDAVQMVYDFWQYLVDLLFVYKYGRHIKVEYIKQYGNIDRILGGAYYEAIKAKLIKLIVFFVCIWLISSLFDYAAWIMSFGWITPTMYAIAYIYLFIKILTTLDLTAHAMHIECRLRSICDLLQECYRSADLPEMVTDCIYNKHWLYSDACSRILKSQLRPNVPKNISQGNENEYDVTWLTRCYLMLIEQTSYVNNMFGIRIILNCLSLLIDMIRFTNLTVRMMIGSQQTKYESGYYPAVASALRLMTCAIVMLSLVHHCEQVYRQNDRILNLIDHLLIAKKPGEKLRAMATELRNLIQSRPIYFNMANFFGLNYSLLISMTSVVVTYSIILLQSLN